MRGLYWKSELHNFATETTDLNLYLLAGYLRLSNLEQWYKPVRKNLFTNPVFLVLTGSVTHPTAETKSSWGEFT